MSERFLTLSEVGALFGHTRSGAQTWQRVCGLPAPDVVVGRAGGWSRATVLAWAAEYRPDLLERVAPEK